MATAAPATLAAPPITNAELSAYTGTTLDIEFLQRIRQQLLKSNTRGEKAQTLEALPTDSEERSLILNLFHNALKIALNPSITTPARIAAIDVLNTYLLGRPIPPSPPPSQTTAPPTTPPSPPTPTATLTTLLTLLLNHYSTPTSSVPALQKSLKDLFHTLLHHTSIPNRTYWTTDLLPVLLHQLHPDSPPAPWSTGGSGGRKVLFFILDTLLTTNHVSAGDVYGGYLAHGVKGTTVIQVLVNTVAGDRTLSPSAGRALVALLGRALREENENEAEKRAEGSGGGGGGDVSLKGQKKTTTTTNPPLNITWYNQWEVPLRAALLEGDDDATGNLTTYALPGIFKLAGAQGLRRFISGFGVSLLSEATTTTTTTPSTATESESVEEGAEGADALLNMPTGPGTEWLKPSTWLTCLRVGRELGLVDVGFPTPTTTASPQSPQSHLLTIPPTLILPLLTHPSPQTRLSALTLLIHSPTTTQPLPPASLALLKHHLAHLHSSTDPEFRNLFCTLIRGLIERLAASSFSAWKKAEKLRAGRAHKGGEVPLPEQQELDKLDGVVESARGFVEWYLRFIEGEMVPGKGYARGSSALRVLMMWVKSGVDASSSSTSSTAASNPPPPPGPGGVGSKKPKSGGGGGQANAVHFPFRVTVFTPTLSRLLIDAMFHSFEDVRNNASELVKLGLLRSAAGKEFLTASLLERCFSRVAESGRARDADGLSHILEVMYEAVAEWGGGVSVATTAGDERKVASPREYVTWLVDDVLKKKFLVRIKDDGLWEGMKDGCGIHGVLGGLKLIFARKSIYAQIAASGEVDQWRELHTKIFDLCRSIWDTIAPVLCESEANGVLISDEDNNDDDAVLDSGDGSAETVLSYSWRAIKGASELLGVILSLAPHTQLVTTEDIKQGGELLLTQLADIRHRGAFLAVSPCFVQVCKRCFESSDPEIREFPRAWLMRNFALIKTKAGVITRRSAGMPFLIIGILAVEVDPKRPLLHEAFSRFVDIVNEDVVVPDTAAQEEDDAAGGGTKVDLPQVHALNCIKLLFTDSRLGGAVSELIGPGLEAAVGCFGSPIWAIRNGGLMLFTALLNRLFGTRKSRNDYSFTAGVYNTKTFFGKYPAVKDVLLSHLEVGVNGLLPSASADVALVEMVYPALSLISRLGNSSGYDMGKFPSLITDCLRSRIWKVREVAAKAYVTLIGADECLSEIDSLLTSDEGSKMQNILHGRICAVKDLIEKRMGEVFRNGSQGAEVTLGKLSEILDRQFEHLVLENPCLVTIALYLEICELVTLDPKGIIVNLSGLTSEDATRSATSSLRRTLSTYTTKHTILAQTPTGSKLVGNAAYRQQLARILANPLTGEFNTNRQAEILSLVEGPDDEVSLAILVALTENPSWLDLEADGLDTLEKLIWAISVKDRNWTELRVAAMDMLHVVLSLKPHDNYSVDDCVVLLDLVTRPRTIPLKESALRVCGRYILGMRESSAEARRELFDTWIGQVVAASQDDISFPSRMAALESIHRASAYLAQAKEGDAAVYFALYKILGDDDDDVRELAADIVSRTVFDTNCPIIPAAAGELLARWLIRKFRAATVGWAVEKIVGRKSAETMVREAAEDSGVLFSKEKQNLWIDEVREVELWRDILVENARDWAGLSGPIERLVRFSIEGLGALCEYGSAHGGVEGAAGPLGWTSASEDIFLVGWRVAAAIRILEEQQQQDPSLQRFGQDLVKIAELRDRLSGGEPGLWQLGRSRSNI